MSDSQTTATVTIEEPVTSTVDRHIYKMVLRDDAGQPVSGAEITVSMTGSGGFATNFHSDEIKRTTDESGEAEFTWFRRGIFTRGVKATVTASVERGDCTLEFVRQEVDTGMKVDWVPTQIRLSPPRV